MGLGDLIRDVQVAKAKGTYLQPYLLESLSRVEDKTVFPEMWMSPSVISKFCPRAWAIAYRCGIPFSDTFGADNRWWMDLGTAMHMVLQEMWLGPAGLIKGGWKCPSCGTVQGYDPDDLTPIRTHGEDHMQKVTPRSAIAMPDRCSQCGFRPNWRTTFSYIEPLLYNPGDKICGWCDGIIAWPSKVQPDELVDFKIPLSLKWVKNAPTDDHVRQLSLYMDMAHIPRGRILYISRSEKHLTDAIIEHPFTLDAEVVTQEKEKVRAFRKAAKDPESSLPACPYGGSRQFGPCDCTRLESAL